MGAPNTASSSASGVAPSVGQTIAAGGANAAAKETNWKCQQKPSLFSTTFRLSFWDVVWSSWEGAMHSEQGKKKSAAQLELQTLTSMSSQAFALVGL
eukprot:2065308-Amphidinium_carterae.1